MGSQGPREGAATPQWAHEHPGASSGFQNPFSTTRNQGFLEKRLILELEKGKHSAWNTLYLKARKYSRNWEVGGARQRDPGASLKDSTDPSGTI